MLRLASRYLQAFCLATLALLILSWPAWGQDVPPRPQGPVADYAKVIPQAYKDKIDQAARELQQKTGAALVVATLPTLGDNTVEEVAVKIFETWGIGQKGVDEGVLILVAVKERRLRIEVGYGLEGLITDGMAGRVRDQAIVPYLKKNQYGLGLYAGAAALAQIIAADKGVALTGVPQVKVKRSSRRFGFGGLLALLVALFVFSRVLRSRSRGRGGGALLTGLFLGSMMSGGRHYGSGGFSGFGGGFGGFGGGMSGGGGASGGF
ncbi:MAG: TPM domain-containing protein [Desulfarculaceae bacterium]